MSFEDFTNKNWEVITKDSTECPEGSTVTFSGSKGWVEITCQVGETTKKPYPPGEYNEGTNRIEEKGKTDGYKIGLQIMFMPPKEESSELKAGSWTAEDQGPWPGDGE